MALPGDCPHCKAAKKKPGYTWFVDFHPINERWEIRRCQTCHKTSVYSCDGKPLQEAS